MRGVVLAAVLVGAGLIGVGYVGTGSREFGAPEPSILPVSWELNFRHGPIERMIMPVDGKNKTFWYIRYTVSNNSGRDVLFTPDFQLVTDTGSVSDAFKNVPNEVFGKIRDLYRNPLLQSPTNILGKLLQGDDNAKDGVIIFGDVAADGRKFQIFVSGLSGETAEVENPVTHQPAVLQKTLELDYSVPGEAINIPTEQKLLGVKWVMR